VVAPTGRSFKDLNVRTWLAVEDDAAPPGWKIGPGDA
jgi:hypothetical protein